VSARRQSGADALSRRRFVALVAAGSASVLSTGVSGAAAKKSTKPAAKVPATKPTATPAPAPAKPAPSAEQKEFDRQKASTQTTLKTIRDYPLPPGGDLAVVFRPLRQPKKGR